MNKINHYTSLNGVRAYAAVGIILLHVLTNIPYAYQGIIFEKIIPSFTDLVFLFMMISSFSMCCGYYEKIKTNRISLDIFYKKRFSKVFPFFVFVSLIEVVANPSVKSLAEFFANSTLIFGLLPNIWFDIIGVGWFLGVVFVFYMLFPFFCYLIWNKKKAWITLALSIVYHVLCQNIFNAPKTNILYCSMFFIVGGILYLYKDDIEIIFHRTNIRIFSLLLIFILYFVYLHFFNILILIPIFVLLIALTISRDSIIMDNLFTKIISDYSLEIYLCHMVIFRILMLMGIHNLIKNIYISFILITLFVLCGALLLSISFHEGLKLINWRIKLMTEKKLNGTVIVTYRCNARCSMCNRYKAPSKPEEEITIETIRKLPKMYFTNITGGEPFIRTDLKDIVRELYKKSDRIVISTNGFFTDRIVDLCKEFPSIGIRISIEGLEDTNNEIRGLQDGYNRGYTTLKKLVEMGMKDVGFGMTVQDKNAPDLVSLYKISDEMGMEFATASLHNSFYFVEAKNIIKDRPMVAQHFEDLINELLRSNSPKKWFRAYFNHGLINYIYGQKRLLPCDMSFDTFFIDPYGDVMPCNGTKDKEVMGNLNTQSWDELWNSKDAETVRAKVRCCDRDCWMIGSVSPAMHKYIWKPALWVIKHKFLHFFNSKKYSMYENKIVRDYRDGKVSKEELDDCSTCDMCAEVNDGLSEQSKKQLKDKTGEEIVDADIAAQMKE